MRVLMLGWELPPHNSGGLGVACYQLCQALAGRGVDIEFILPYSLPEAPGFMRVHSAQLQHTPQIALNGGAYDSYAYVLPDGTTTTVDIFGQQQIYEQAVGQFAADLEFDVIHAHDWLTFRGALRAKAQRQTPLILHIHSIESDRAGGQPGNPLVRDIEQTTLLLADRIIAVSDHTKQAIMRDYQIPSSKIQVVHNSLDITTMPELEGDNAYRYLSRMKQLGYKVVTNVGRLTIQKGLPNLLRAAKEVIEREPKTLFLIVGAGEQYYELIELAATLGISQNVIFVGFQRGKRWRDAFGVADLFVMPSISEPFGLTPLEAAGFGAPSLISKQSGVSEVLHNCLKVDFWDTAKMADQILSVIRYDGLQQELAANAHHEYLQLSWQSAADQLHHLYHNPQGIPV